MREPEVRRIDFVEQRLVAAPQGRTDVLALRRIAHLDAVT